MTRARFLVCALLALRVATGATATAGASARCDIAASTTDDVKQDWLPAVRWVQYGPDWPVDLAADGDVGVAVGEVADVVAYDLTTGTMRWFNDLEAPTNTVPVIGTRIVAVTAGPSVFGLDRATGKVRWEHRVKPIARLALIRRVDREILLVAERGGRFSALDLDTGAQLWSRAITSPHVWWFEVHASARVVVASTAPRHGGWTHVALDPDTGAERWRARSARRLPEPLLVAGLVVTGSERPAEVVARDEVTGAVRWRQELHGPGARNFTMQGDDREIAVLAACGQLTLTSSATGATVWTTSIGQPPSATRVLLTPTRVVLTAGTNVFTVDRAAGGVHRLAEGPLLLHGLASVGESLVALLDIQDSGVAVVLDGSPGAGVPIG